MFHCKRVILELGLFSISNVSTITYAPLMHFASRQKLRRPGKHGFYLGAIWYLLLSGTASAIPRTGQPPVIFINGYEFSCLLAPGFTGTFGNIGQYLASDGRSSVFFDTCNCKNCDIPQHAKKFADELTALRYDDGGAIDQVDVVAHSMGGLIVRAYLAGQNSLGNFAPPLDPRIRKIVFVATPQFGLLSPVIDTETDQLQIGSRFVWNQAIWNQGADDLRGVDAVAVAGNGGSSHTNGGYDDGIVPITSASLSFAASFAADASRTRVIPYCHNGGFPFVINCRPDAPAIAKMDTPMHPTAIVVRSFLADSPDWRGVGKSAAEDPVLSRNGGLITDVRDSSDHEIAISGVKADPYTFSSNAANVYYREFMTPQTYSLLYQGNPSVQVALNVSGGGIRAVPFKLSPAVARIYPSAAALNALSLAPGMLISAYGNGLANSTVLLNDAPLQVLYNGDTQVNAVLPSGTTGLAKLTLRNPKGEHSQHVMIEPAAPAIFSLDRSGTGAAAATDAITGAVIGTQNPIHAGQFVALYATGLGDTQRRGGLDYASAPPSVTIGGMPARVLFAGRAPGFTGLDQINVEVPAGAAGSSLVSVTVGHRTSNAVTIAIQ
ncbi:MAG: hypothetical protein M3Z85_03420 [Acidobacteriota bacterium]|nr:hypothetical protein [Acidobacteriota bacterium]